MAAFRGEIHEDEGARSRGPTRNHRFRLSGPPGRGDQPLLRRPLLRDQAFVDGVLLLADEPESGLGDYLRHVEGRLRGTLGRGSSDENVGPLYPQRADAAGVRGGLRSPVREFLGG